MWITLTLGIGPTLVHLRKVNNIYTHPSLGTRLCMDNGSEISVQESLEEVEIEIIHARS